MKRFLLLLQHNLLLSVTIALFSGIILWATIDVATSYFPYFFTAIALLLVPTRKKSCWRNVFICLISFFLIGCYLGSTLEKEPTHPSHIYTLIQEKKEVALHAILKSVRAFDGTSTEITITANGIQFPKELAFSPVTGTILLTLKDELSHSLQPGDTILVRATLKPPKGYRTPGSFNYKKYLAEKDIWITGYISSSLFIQQVSPPRTFFQKIVSFPERLRLAISRAIDNAIPTQVSPIYKALLIGDRSGISQDVLEEFKGSGTMHLLAISGLHMSLLGVFLFTIFSWILRRSETLIFYLNIKKTAAILCVLPLLGYTLLAGSNTPVLRSFIMASIAILALYTDRVKSLGTIIAATALFLVAFNPSTLFTPSFQLTFSAVIAITAITPLFQNTSKKERKGLETSFIQVFFNWIFIAMVVSLSATLGTAPLLLYHFNRISTVGVIANLIIEPLLCLWSLPLGFIATISLTLSSDLAGFFFQLGSHGIVLAIKAAHAFNSIPYASIRLPSPTPLQICLFYGGMMTLLLGHNLRKSFLYALGILLISVSIYLSIPSFTHLQRSTNYESSIHFIEVGHGSSTLLQLPGGINVLIDGGSYASPDFDIGERVIAPFLWKQGITHIDTVIITHPDSDHINGLPFIIEQFTPKQIWTNTLTGKGFTYHQFLKKAKILGIPITVPKPSETLVQSEGALLQILPNPLRQQKKRHTTMTPPFSKLSSNDNGLIIKYTHNNLSILFPGDISKKVESELLQENSPVQAKVLLSPHHGSRHSNSISFLENVAPSIMIVSTSKSVTSSKYSLQLRDTCQHVGIDLYTTSDNGTISLTTQEKGKKIFMKNSNTSAPQPLVEQQVQLNDTRRLSKNSLRESEVEEQKE